MHQPVAAAAGVLIQGRVRQVTNFGNPFLMRVGERETLAQLKPRIQARVVHLDRVRIP